MSGLSDILGSVFPQKFDINDEIETLTEELRTIADLKILMQNETFRKLLEVWQTRIHRYESDIVSLSSNPKKNEKELIWKRARVDALKDFFDVIESTLREENNVAEKLLKLKGITETHRTAPAML